MPGKLQLTANRNVTGRDGFILTKALAYAILAIERLPFEWQERSDKEDMFKLLEAMTSEDTREIMFIIARSHLERRRIQPGNKLVLADHPNDGSIVQFPHQHEDK